MSFPSTGDTPFADNRIDNEATKDFHLPLNAVVEVEEDLLTPPDGAYPFVTWESLTVKARERYGAAYLGAELSKRGWKTSSIPPTLLISLLARLTPYADPERHRGTTTDIQHFRGQARRLVDELIQQITKTTEALEHGQPVPAHPHHLMGTGSMLRRAQKQVQAGSALLRDVTFNEPVNAWTCLNGDRLAHPGAMLTGMTVTATEAWEVPDSISGTKTVHKAKAVSL